MIPITFIFPDAFEWAADWPAVPRIGDNVRIIDVNDPYPLAMFTVVNVLWTADRKKGETLRIGVYVKVFLANTTSNQDAP